MRNGGGCDDDDDDDDNNNNNFAAWVVCEWRRPGPLAIQLFVLDFASF